MIDESKSVLVVLNQNSANGWRVVRCLETLGWHCRTFDVLGVITAPDIRLPEADVILTGSVLSKARALAAHSRSSGVDRVLAVYGGRHALVLAVASVLHRSLRPAIYLVGSDILRPIERHRLRAFMERSGNSLSLRRMRAVAANGKHLLGHVPPGPKKVQWTHGIEIPEDLPPLDSAPRPVTLIAPRPWRPPYNNDAIAYAVRRIHSEGGLSRAWFVGPAEVTQSSVRSELSGLDGISMKSGYEVQEIDSMFGQADLVCSMSSSDGMPNVVLEAALRGSIPVLSPSAATLELLDTGVQAFVAKGFRGEDCLRSIREALAARDRWLEMRHTNRQVVIERFNVDQNMSGLERLMELIS